MLRAYAFRILLFALVGLILGVAISVVATPKYEAAMQVLVDPHEQMAGVAMSNAEKSVNDILESSAPRSVQTQVEQLTGFGTLQKAAQAVADARNRPVTAFPELSLTYLQKAVTVEAATESDLVTVKVRMKDKDMARDLLSEIFNAFDEENQERSRDVGERAINKLKSQNKPIQDQLNAVNQKLAKLREQYNTPDVNLKIQAQLETQKNAQQIRDQALAEYSAAQANASSLSAQLPSIPKTIDVGSSRGYNPAIAQIEGQLARDRSTLDQLRVRYLDDSPQVMEQKALVLQEQDQLDRMQKDIPASKSVGPNPAYQTVVTQLAIAKASAAAAKEKYDTAIQAYNTATKELESLPEVRRQMEDLTRQQENLTLTSQDNDRQLTAMEASQRGRITSTTLASPAIAFPDPVSPNYTLNIGAGTIAGLLLGLLSAFGLESRRSPIRNLSQLNRLTLEPAFRTIPELPFIPLGIDKQPDEVFVTLLGNFIRSEKRPYRIGVLGVEADSGATVAASSMALGASIEGNDTLLVDTARDNGATKRLGLPAAQTFIDASEKLTVLRTGGEELSQAQMIVDTIKSLEARRALTIIDLNPFKSSGNPVLYLAGLDECILLVRAGKTRTVDFLQAQQMLIDAGVPQVTVVLARAKTLDDDFTFMPAEPQAQALMGR